MIPYSYDHHRQRTLKARLRHFFIRLFSIFRIGRIMSIMSSMSSAVIDHDLVEISFADSLQSSKKIAIFAHYSNDGRISSSDAFFIAHLRESGYSVVISSTATCDPIVHRALWEQWRDRIDGLITRPNMGFDFASWSVALSAMKLDSEALNRIVLVNNSMYGPLFPLEPIIDSLASRGDFFGLTASQEFSPHLQSYFLGFNPVVFRDPAFRQFWEGKFGVKSKWSTIFGRELTWERFFVKEGFRSVILMSGTRGFPRNPLTFLWKELVSDGFPFIKKSLFSHNYDAIDLSDWKSFLREISPNFDTNLITSDLKN